MRTFRFVALLIPFLLIVGCYPAGSAEVQRAQAVAAEYGLTVVKPLGNEELILPENLDPEGLGGFDAPFIYALIQESASVDGYDLRPHLGQQVVERSYRLRERHSGERTRLHLIEKDDRVIAAYGTVENSVPGMISLSGIGAQ